MLEQVDLGQKLIKSEYKNRMDLLSNQLGELHRKIHDLAMPIRRPIHSFGNIGIHYRQPVN